MILDQTGVFESLKHFSFHEIASGVIRDLLGEVRRPSWLEYDVSVNRSTSQSGCVIYLFLRVKGAQATFEVDADNVVHVKPPPSQRRFTAQLFIEDHADPEKIVERFSGWVRGEMLRIAHKIYEFDPRIGWHPSVGAPLLPRSPLFDPPGPFSRSGALSNSENLCPFCKESEAGGDEVFWAGANLMWVHAQCWSGLR